MALMLPWPEDPKVNPGQAIDGSGEESIHICRIHINIMYIIHIYIYHVFLNVYICMGQRGRGCVTRLQDTSENGSWPTEADWQAWAAKYQTDSEVEAGVRLQ